MLFKKLYSVEEYRFAMKVKELLRTRFGVHAATAASGKYYGDVHKRENVFRGVFYKLA